MINGYVRVEDLGFHEEPTIRLSCLQDSNVLWELD